MHYRGGETKQIIGHALLILPAVGLGVFAMAVDSVSPVLWGQQAAAWAVFALLAGPVKRAAARMTDEMWCCLLLLPLIMALFGEEAGGARRWMELGVFHVHTANLVLPGLLVILSRVRLPQPVLLGAATALCVQPDFSQLAALFAAAIPILWRNKNRRWGIAGVLMLGALMAVCAGMPVALEPARHCEGILTMLADVSGLLHAAGCVSLAAIPAYGLIRFRRSREIRALSLAVYYAVCILFSFLGNDPVPFMGFGLSSIAGYWLAWALDSANEGQDGKAKN